MVSAMSQLAFGGSLFASSGHKSLDQLAHWLGDGFIAFEV